MSIFDTATLNGLLDGDSGSPFDFSTPAAVSATPANANTANESAFSLNSLAQGLLGLAGQVIPAYFSANQTQAASPVYATASPTSIAGASGLSSTGLLLIVGAVILVIVLKDK